MTNSINLHMRLSVVNRWVLIPIRRLRRLCTVVSEFFIVRIIMLLFSRLAGGYILQSIKITEREDCKLLVALSLNNYCIKY
jgi:hypothetical protein